MAVGSHPFPFRTRKLSPPAPMVLGWNRPGRVGRRRISNRKAPPCAGPFVVLRPRREQVWSFGPPRTKEYPSPSWPPALPLRLRRAVAALHPVGLLPVDHPPVVARPARVRRAVEAPRNPDPPRVVGDLVVVQRPAARVVRAHRARLVVEVGLLEARLRGPLGAGQVSLEAVQVRPGARAGRPLAAAGTTARPRCSPLPRDGASSPVKGPGAWRMKRAPMLLPSGGLL